MSSPDAGPRAFVPRVLAVVGIVAVATIVLLLAWQAAAVLLTIFAGVLLGILLRGLATWVSARTGLSALPALAVVCVAVALGVVAALTFTAASVSQQLSELLDELPRALEQARSAIAANPLGQRLLVPLESANGGDGAISPAQVFGAASRTLGAVGTAVLVAFLGLFFAADPDIYRRGLAALLPPSVRPRLIAVLDEAGDTLLRWLAGRLLLMAVIGVLTWLGLLLLGVPLALALAIVAGALSFIPNLGPVLSAVPAMLLAASVEPMLAVWVAVLYLGIQTAESYVLEPLVVRRTVELPPATNIAFQLLMATWLGIPGVTLATPLLALLVVVVSRVYVEDVLGDDADQAVSTSSPPRA